jgi:choline dehydrogenase-like flavoprotein
VIQSGLDLEENQTVRSQICVIGAGPAGVILTLELAKAGLDVILLESGGLEAGEPYSADLKGTLVNARHHAGLDECRSRQLGGTSAQWAGRCVPLDPIDFEHRDYAENSGWPIEFEDLARFYPRANHYCHAGSCAYEVSKALPGAPPSIVPGFPNDVVSSTRLERWSLPTRFGKHYRKDLEANAHIRVLLHSVCTDIELGEHGAVTSLLAATEPGRHFHVKARVIVVAGGGLESTRLLLASRRYHSEGIGNANGHLGRYYMGHLFGSVAEIQFHGDPRKTIYGFERDRDGIYCRRRFWIDPETQRQNRLLNTALWLTNPPAADPGHGNGVLSAASLALQLPGLRDRLAPAALRKAFLGQADNASWLPHLRNTLMDLPSVAYRVPRFLYKRYMPQRRIPALFLYNRSNRYSLFYHAEQLPHRHNQVSLDTERDRFGMPILRIDYRYDSPEIDSVCRAHEVLAGQLHMCRLGTLHYRFDDLTGQIQEQASDGFHQIGTTRMSRQERDGVVDTNCQVHGVSNLYVCSSSVFPTGGQANPTLSIVALAVRLGQYLGRTLPRG